ncbi:MAG: hypothetical protein WCP68_12915, partial [Enhydrobacter sp.]
TVLDRRCETDRGDILHPADVLAMLFIGQMRRMILRDDGSVLARSTVRKWGLMIGRVELVIRRV